MASFYRGAFLGALASGVGLQGASSDGVAECAFDDVLRVSFLQESAVVTTHLTPAARQGKQGHVLNHHTRLPADLKVIDSSLATGRTQLQLQLPEDDTSLPPSYVWSSSGAWLNVSEKHPVGVRTTLPEQDVEWNEVSYFSIPVLLALCGVAYPIALVMLLLVLTVVTSMCLVVDREKDPHEVSGIEQSSPEVTPTAPSSTEGDILTNFRRSLPLLPKMSLTSRSQHIYSLWACFSCAVPSMMVFGNPILMLALARPYPQEVTACLCLLTSIFFFGNAMYFWIFGSNAVVNMSMADDAEYAGVLPEGSESQVFHWVILPQYKEDVEVVSMALRSISCSSIAQSSIGIVLAMEEREEGAKDKVTFFEQNFEGMFKEMIAVYHPPNLPNDPPGKASNVAHAFKALLHHIRPSEEEAARVVLTVADADSEFHEGYFESLSCQFLATDKDIRYHRFWQAPVLHLKNYHRQPSPVIVGTMFTAVQELSTLSDPNAVRFPYSTYSLSLKLARQVGGWDAEWIAEDYHMGIKCFLMTLGKTAVEPVMLPIINYTPEGSSWLDMCLARWTQLKRHALGFSDLSYYFMMLPLIFSYLASGSGAMTRREGLASYWRMMCGGIPLLIKLLNVHVVIGVLSTYGVLALALQMLMKIAFQDDRTLDSLVLHLGLLPALLTVCTGLGTLITSVLFLKVCGILARSGRIEGTPQIKHPFLHWLANLLGLALYAPFYFFMLGYAIWCAALSVLTKSSFEYEVAPKTASKSQET